MIKYGVVFIKNKGNLSNYDTRTDGKWIDMLTWETHTIFGNPGRYKTYDLLRELCIFRNMHRIIMDTIKKFDDCQKNKPLN